MARRKRKKAVKYEKLSNAYPEGNIHTEVDKDTCAVSSDVVDVSTSVENINAERTEMLELEIQKMNVLSEMIEESRLPSHQPETKKKTWNQRISERCDDWEKSKEE